MLDVMSEATLRFERLRKRPDFLLAAKAPALSRGAVFIHMLTRAEVYRVVRVGYPPTKTLGGAVDRNRAKRRLREAARLVLPLHARPSHDYVFIARGGTTTREWGRLLDDVKSALISLAAEHDGVRSKVSRSSSGEPSPAVPSQQPDHTVSG